MGKSIIWKGFSENCMKMKETGQGGMRALLRSTNAEEIWMMATDFEQSSYYEMAMGMGHFQPFESL